MNSTNLYQILSNDTHKNMCFCPCTKVIPESVGFGQPMIEMESAGLDLNIVNGVAQIVYSQAYENKSSNPIECNYQFPADNDYAVTKMVLKMDDKTVETEIMNKKKAEQKYEDAVAGGNVGVKASYDEEVPEVINLQIGQLQPGKSIEVAVTMVTQLQAVGKMFYNFNFPIAYFKKAIGANFNFSASINGSSAINSIQSSLNLDINSGSEDGKTHMVTFTGGVPDRDI